MLPVGKHMDGSKQASFFVADSPVDERAWSPVVTQGLGAVVHWSDGERLLLAVLEGAEPDLIFLEAELSAVSGLEICRRLRIHPATRDTPVIILSSVVNATIVDAALAVGATDVLLKPINPDLLRARIRSYLAVSQQSLVPDFEPPARTDEREPMIEPMRTEPGDRERTLARTEFLFSHDLITGLPNRRQMLDLLERSRRRADNTRLPMAVIALCVHDYGAVQASMPKEEFDRLMAAAALAIQQVLRPMDLVARVAEDLFAVVLVPRELDSVDRASRNAREVANRAARALADGLVLDGKAHPLQLRCATAVYPRDGQRGNDLLRHLEQTLSAMRGESARERRRSMAPDLASMLAMELRLRHAIESDRLVPHYQPKIDACSGAMIGGETLIRWPLSTGEYVGPAEFVPVAEAGGLIPALDDYVLTAACCQIAEWQARFSNFRIGVNLSALKLHHRGIFDRLRELLATTGARAEHLELEITESALITDFDAASRWLCAVREMGVSVALDDFGTGYSSLAYLRRLPLDTIKIDQTFVACLETDRSTVAIVRAMISMAKALGMSVVAEGVETRAQADILRRLGCDALQGFLYSAAVPAREFEAMLERGRVDASGIEVAVASDTVISLDSVRKKR